MERILALEKNRRLRVQTVLLEDKNDDMHMHLARDGSRIRELETCNRDLEDAVQGANANLQSVNNDLRISSREIETLKVLFDMKSPEIRIQN